MFAGWTAKNSKINLMVLIVCCDESLQFTRHVIHFLRMRRADIFFQSETDEICDGGKMVVGFLKFIWLLWILTYSEAGTTHKGDFEGIYFPSPCFYQTSRNTFRGV